MDRLHDTTSGSRERPEGGEAALLRRIRDGDIDAFQRFVDGWQPRLARFFHLMGARGSETDDLRQEVFLRVYRHRRRFEPRGEAAVRAYVLRIARNVYIDLVRKRRRGIQVAPLEAGEKLVDPRTIPPSGPDTRAAADDRFDLESAVRALPDKLREVIVLSTWEGLNYPDMAAILEIPVGTVKSRMYYAVRQLREVFDVRTLS